MAKEEPDDIDTGPSPPEVTPVVQAFTRSESLKQIAPALLHAQRKLENPEKNAKNPHFGNRYADLGACTDAAKAALNSQDIVLVQVGAPAPYGSVGVTTLALHKSGEWIGGTFLCPLDRDNAQGLGSAVTYLRRYGVSAICGMVAEDDDDGNAASAHREEAPKASGGKKSLFGRR